MIRKWIVKEWILEGVSGRTLPIALSITLLGSWRRPYSILIIGLRDD
jgi:hypothetical protein